eukprot:Gregarina_sp_Poly_1__9146@NODE_561_length_7528_cov_34_720949_g441_i0_p5_GENE_NODE_561_length_7528_cov_34_720949_g441_i0NODE_561_length_7528_cov_34_720949_g441_i0_p5_ORF_typecomplete_len268_score16_86Glyco_hydro_19/PF00182_19/4_2e15_NODE_561_length_7528_cov_34_720949_g441_i025804
MITGNMNYAEFGHQVYGDAAKFLNQPELLEQDPVIAWKAALWMYGRRSWAGQPSAHGFMQGAKSNDFRFQSGYGGALSAMGGYCSRQCGQVDENGIKAESQYKRFTKLMGAKLCALPTEWTTCGGTRFPQSFEADCRKKMSSHETITLNAADAVSECIASNVGSYPEGFPIVEGPGVSSTEPAPGIGTTGSPGTTPAPGVTSSDGAGGPDGSTPAGGGNTPPPLAPGETSTSQPGGANTEGTVAIWAGIIAGLAVFAMV